MISQSPWPVEAEETIPLSPTKEGEGRKEKRPRLIVKQDRQEKRIRSFRGKDEKKYDVKLLNKFYDFLRMKNQTLADNIESKYLVSERNTIGWLLVFSNEKGWIQNVLIDANEMLQVNEPMLHSWLKWSFSHNHITKEKDIDPNHLDLQEFCKLAHCNWKTTDLPEYMQINPNLKFFMNRITISLYHNHFVSEK